MPSKPPVQPPPSPSMSAPKEVPKTESPALPVPAPEASKPAPAPVQKTAAAPAPSSQGFNWEEFSKVSMQLQLRLQLHSTPCRSPYSIQTVRPVMTPAGAYR